MRALVCSRLDGFEGIAVGDLPEEEIRPGTARVAIDAAGVNFPDLLVIQGLYQDRPPLPFAPGFEIAGMVTETAGDVTSVAAGDRVFASVPHGGYAESAVVDIDRLFPIPEGMDAASAAALPIAYGTSIHALLDRGGLAAGDSLLVLGAAGGVGLAAVQIGAAAGAEVIAAVSSEDKEAAVRDAGAGEVIRYERDDLRSVLKETHPGGVDVVFDPVGGDVTEAALRSTAWRGRHLVIGFASGSIPDVPANLPLLKGASLVGVYWGRFAETEPEANRENMATLTRWWSEGSIRPLVSATFPLEDAAEALRTIGGRRAIGKLVIEP